jgi:hypothetical protein
VRSELGRVCGSGLVSLGCAVGCGSRAGGRDKNFLNFISPLKFGYIFKRNRVRKLEAKEREELRFFIIINIIHHVLFCFFLLHCICMHLA